MNKVSDSPGILVQITRGKTLIGTVKEGEVTLGLHDIGNLTPLLLGGIDARGIVGTGVENDNRALWSVLEKE